MTKPKSTETSLVASTVADKADANMTPAEIAAVKRDQEGESGKEKPFQPATVLVCPTSERPTITLKSACSRFPAVRKAFVAALVHLFGSESGNIYSLANFHGVPAKLALILADHVKRRVSTRHAVQRINNLMTDDTLQLVPAPREYSKQASISAHTPEQLAAKVTHETGPSDYATVIALVLEIRSLQSVSDKAGMLSCKAEVVKAQIALDFALENWSPFEREKHPDPEVQGKIQPRQDLSIVRFTDEQGDWIHRMRTNLAVASETVHQRERLKLHLKSLRNSHSWITGILKEVDAAIEAGMVEQEKRDRAAQRTEALAHIKAGYDTDCAGRRWDRFLSEQERQALAAAKEELERDLSVETQNK